MALELKRQQTFIGERREWGGMDWKQSEAKRVRYFDNCLTIFLFRFYFRLLSPLRLCSVFSAVSSYIQNLCKPLFLQSKLLFIVMSFQGGDCSILGDKHTKEARVFLL